MRTEAQIHFFIGFMIRGNVFWVHSFVMKVLAVPVVGCSGLILYNDTVALYILKIIGFTYGF